MGVSAGKFGRMDKDGERWAPPLSTQVGASGSSSPNSSLPHPHPNPSPAFAGELTPSSPRSVRTEGQPLRLGVGEPPRLPRCAHPRLGTAARSLPSSGSGGPKPPRTGRKGARLAPRNLPGRKPAPSSSSSGGSSGGGSAPGPPSSMAHRAGSRRGRLPSPPRPRSQARARPTSCPRAARAAPSTGPGSAAPPAGREGGDPAGSWGLWAQRRGPARTCPPPASEEETEEGEGEEGRRGGGGKRART